MDYVGDQLKSMGPPSCPSAAAPAPAPGQPGQPGQPAAQQEARDPSLVGSWGRTDSISSGDASMSTKLSLLICGDGSFVRTTGQSAGGGAGWSASSGGSESTRGRWRTQGGVIYTSGGAGGWAPYARYYVEGAKLMFTFQNGQREVWYR